MERREKDSLGEVFVPNNSYWGAQTERSRKFFSIGEEQMSPVFIKNYACLKWAAASANYALKKLSKEKMEKIIEVCKEIIEGKHADQFPLKIWQTGSGTQTNMNVNEVIANRAKELGTLLHPNDDVNLSQSSNDTFPTVMHMTAFELLEKKLLPELRKFQDLLEKKTQEFALVMKTGRTHLMDATPISLGQEFSGYQDQIQRAIAQIEYAKEPLLSLAIGGSAVGTGIHVPKGFSKLVTEKLQELLGFAFVSAENFFSQIAAHDLLVFSHGSLKNLAVSLTKIATDCSWMGSGPRCGLGEVKFPQNEPGSSIMPGKVNPTQCEAILMVTTKVMGNDVTMSIAGSRGNFELNVFKPLLIYTFTQSVSLLTDSIHAFGHYFVEGLLPNFQRLQQQLHDSLMLVTALTPHIGYENAAKIAHLAYEREWPLKKAAVTLGFLSEQQFDEIVDPKKMGNFPN